MCDDVHKFSLPDNVEGEMCSLIYVKLLQAHLKKTTKLRPRLRMAREDAPAYVFADLAITKRVSFIVIRRNGKLVGRVGANGKYIVHLQPFRELNRTLTIAKDVHRALDWIKNGGMRKPQTLDLSNPNKDYLLTPGVPVTAASGNEVVAVGAVVWAKRGRRGQLRLKIEWEPRLWTRKLSVETSDIFREVGAGLSLANWPRHTDVNPEATVPIILDGVIAQGESV